MLSRLGRDATDGLAMGGARPVLDRLMDDDGPTALLAGDRVVDVGALTAGSVLTHRVRISMRSISPSTWPGSLAGPSSASAMARRCSPIWMPAGLERPPGWLSGYEPGDILAVRADPSGLITLDVITQGLALDTDMVELVRAVYDKEWPSPWLPVSGEDLILGVLAEDGSDFSRPRLPLEDLCAAAGQGRSPPDRRCGGRTQPGRRVCHVRLPPIGSRARAGASTPS